MRLFVLGFGCGWFIASYVKTWIYAVSERKDA